MNETFADVRKLPTGRASVFVPDVRVLNHFKTSEEQKKGTIKRIDNHVAELVSKLNIPSMYSLQIQQIIELIPRRDDMDANILVIAAYMYLIFPGGIANPNDIAQSNQVSSDNIRPFLYPIISAIVKEKNEYDAEKGPASGGSKLSLENSIILDVLGYHHTISKNVRRLRA